MREIGARGLGHHAHGSARHRSTTGVERTVESHHARHRPGSRAAFGLNSAQVSQTLQTLLSRATVAEYREGTENIDVMVRAVPGNASIPPIGDLTILARNGQAIPLSQVATIRYGFEEPILCGATASLI